MNQGGPKPRARSIARARDITLGASVGLLVAVAMATHTKSSAPARSSEVHAVAPWIEQAIARERSELQRARATEEGHVFEATVTPVSGGYVSMWAVSDDDTATIRCAVLGADGSLRSRPVQLSSGERRAVRPVASAVGDRVAVAWIEVASWLPFRTTPMWAVVDKHCAVLRPNAPVGFEGRARFMVDVAFDGARVAFVSRGLDRGPEVQVAIRSIEGLVIANETIDVDEPGLLSAVTATERGFLVAFDEHDFARSKTKLRAALVSPTGTHIQSTTLRHFDGRLAFVQSARGSERGFVWGEDGDWFSSRFETFVARVRGGEALSPLRVSERSTSSTRDAACNARGCLHAWTRVGPETTAQPRFATEFRDVDGRVERGPIEHAVEGASLRFGPSVAASADGTSFLSLIATQRALYAQRFDHSGRPQGAPIAIH
ncbi:MAG: hypothetical protein JNK05_08620 [Myxococcales bacterium]|nr:hypothetical protein [Myxococcales bacterium]